MLFYTVFAFSSANYNRLFMESCVLYVANFVGWERRDGMCGLIYLMVMFTGNTRGRVTVKPVRNQKTATCKQQQEIPQAATTV